MDQRVVVARYPLTPAQQGMVMHTLREPRAGLYVPQMVCTLREAHWSYRARPYPGSALLIAAHVSSDKVGHPALGWERLIDGGVRLHVLSATHGSLLQNPIVASVAAILQQELDATTSPSA